MELLALPMISPARTTAVLDSGGRTVWRLGLHQSKVQVLKRQAVVFPKRPLPQLGANHTGLGRVCSDSIRPGHQLSALK